MPAKLLQNGRLYPILGVLRELDLEVIDVLGNGDCLFRCLSVLLYGHEELCRRLRNQIVDYILSRYSEFAAQIQSAYLDVKVIRTAGEYKDFMRDTKEWASLVELKAASMMWPFLGVTVYSTDLGFEAAPQQFNEDAGLQYKILHTGNHYQLAQDVQRAETIGSAVWQSRAAVRSVEGEKGKIAIPDPSERERDPAEKG